MLDCKSFEPFEVLEFPYEFDGDPQRVIKLWIVAQNIPAAETIIFFKPTSSTTRYDREPSMLLGVVEYQPGEIEIFPRRTIVDPQSYPIHYSHLRKCYIDNALSSIGRLPEDFRSKIGNAANNKPEWRKKDRDYFFRWFDPKAS